MLTLYLILLCVLIQIDDTLIRLKAISLLLSQLFVALEYQVVAHPAVEINDCINFIILFIDSQATLYLLIVLISYFRIDTLILVLFLFFSF